MKRTAAQKYTRCPDCKNVCSGPDSHRKNCRNLEFVSALNGVRGPMPPTDYAEAIPLPVSPEVNVEAIRSPVQPPINAMTKYHGPMLHVREFTPEEKDAAMKILSEKTPSRFIGPDRRVLFTLEEKQTFLNLVQLVNRIANAEKQRE